MKKFFDRYLFSKLGLQILFSVVLILVFSWVFTIIKNIVLGDVSDGNVTQALWGFRQFLDGGVIVETIDNLDEISKKSAVGVPVMMTITLLAWLMGIVLCGFVTGAIVNAFDGRREKIATGKTRYKFRGHGIVIGWDFQGIGAVRGLMERYNANEVVILSSRDRCEIEDELSEVFSSADKKRIYIYNGSLGDNEQIQMLDPQSSRAIVVLGDDNAENNDGSNLCMAQMLNDHIVAGKVAQWSDFWVYVYNFSRKYSRVWNCFFAQYDVTNGKLFKDSSTFSVSMRLLFTWWKIKAAFLKKHEYVQREIIDCYVDITNDYSLEELEKLLPSGSLAGKKYIAFKGFNFYREATLELFDANCDMTFKRHPDVKSVEILVSGFNSMSRSIIRNAKDFIKKDMKLSIRVYAKDAADEYAKFVSTNPMHGFNIELIENDISSIEVRSELVSRVRDITSCVSIFLLDDSPDVTMEMLCRMPQEIANENIRVYVEQRTYQKWSPRISRKGFPYVQKFGFVDDYYRFLMKRPELTLNDEGINPSGFLGVFNEVIGVVGLDVADERWQAKNETVYETIVSAASKIRIVDFPAREWHMKSAWRDKKEDRVALLVCLNTFAGYEVARMAYKYGIPYVVVLQRDLSQVVTSIEDEAKRFEFLRLIRNSYSYVVDESSQNYILSNSNAIFARQRDLEVVQSLLAGGSHSVRKVFSILGDDAASAKARSIADIGDCVAEISLVANNKDDLVKN